MNVFGPRGVLVVSDRDGEGGMRSRMGTTWAFRVLIVPAVLLLGLSACGSESADQVGPQGPAGSGGQVPSGEYTSIKVTDGGKPKHLVNGTRITLTFAGSEVRANAGCNTMSGPVTFQGGHLVVTDLAMTEMGCPGEGRHEQDTWVADFLTARPAYTLAHNADGDRLDLTTDTAGITLKPRAQVVPDQPLEGTRWTVTHVTQGPAADAVDDPDAAVSAGMAPPKAYLQFADGKVTGNDGCNRLSGPATVTDDTITFGEIVSTKMACPGVDTAGIRRVLEGTVTYRIHIFTLTLTAPSGAGLQLTGDQGGADGAFATPPCCKPPAGEDGADGADGSTGTGGAPTSVNPAGPADAPPGS